RGQMTSRVEAGARGARDQSHPKGQFSVARFSVRIPSCIRGSPTWTAVGGGSHLADGPQDVAFLGGLGCILLGVLELIRREVPDRVHNFALAETYLRIAQAVTDAVHLALNKLPDRSTGIHRILTRLLHGFARVLSRLFQRLTCVVRAFLQGLSAVLSSFL